MDSMAEFYFCANFDTDNAYFGSEWKWNSSTSDYWADYDPKYFSRLARRMYAVRYETQAACAVGSRNGAYRARARLANREYRRRLQVVLPRLQSRTRLRGTGGAKMTDNEYSKYIKHATEYFGNECEKCKDRQDDTSYCDDECQIQDVMRLLDIVKKLSVELCWCRRYIDTLETSNARLLDDTKAGFNW